MNEVIHQAPGPYVVIISGLAQVNVSKMEPDIGAVLNGVLCILQYDPEVFELVSNEPGGHEFTMAITHVPGGALAIRFSLDKQRKEVRILDVMYPAQLKVV